MKFMYRNRIHIVRMLLVYIVFTLLLVFNFNIWCGAYFEGSLQDILAHESKELEHCIIINYDNRENIKTVAQANQLLDAGFAPIIIDCVLLWFIHFICILGSKFFNIKRYTLVSLCVRMDD